ncbi:glycoside hydrolase family 19 protein [Commensalibacter communis]|nr:hypothetical protein [Commensalibacter communis]CAI3961910.1 Chitinase [Commensalibacter communis]
MEKWQRPKINKGIFILEDPYTLPAFQPFQKKDRGSAYDATRGAVYPKVVTIEMLDAANPEGKGKQNLEIVLPLNQYFGVYGISNKKEIAHFLSQTAHESQLKKTEEDLDYRPKQMRKIFGCAGNSKGYDPQKDDCKPGRKKIRPMLWSEEKKYAHNPENLGNLVYNRKSMGNTELGDGFKYRGRGIIQLTGKNNYKQFQKIHEKNNPQDKKDFVKNPDLLISSYQYAIEGAVIYWMHREGLHTTAQTGTVEAVTNIVNNGLNGYRDRLKRFNKVAPLLGITQESK